MSHCIAPSQYFQRVKLTKSLRDDPLQNHALKILDQRWLQLLRANSSIKWPWSKHISWRHIYIYGGVGRGKSLLMDIFFHVLPFEQKRRVHFHHFMFEVHQGLKNIKHEKNPIKILGQSLLKNCKVLCLDEFLISDIADAMIFKVLLEELVDKDILIITTSNVPPCKLYEGGLQRQNFLPVIRLIEERFELIHLDYGIDYRLLALSQEVLWFGVNQQQRYMNLFDQLAIGLDELNLYIQYSGPDIILQRHHLGILMLDFKYLVAQPLGKSDYLHITTEYHTIFISNLYCLNYKNDEARRFIWFIDMCYDHKVKLVVLATVDIDHIYSANQPLSLEFSRTHSRMIEMQSSSYLANAHTTHNFKFL